MNIGTHENDLSIRLGFLLSHKEFWSTSSHYERQKSFTLSNNYNAHQVHYSINALHDKFKSISKEMTKTSENLCFLYNKFNVPTDKLDSLALFIKQINLIKENNKTLKEKYKLITEELDKPDPIQSHDYNVLHANIQQFAQEIIFIASASHKLIDSMSKTESTLQQEACDINLKAKNGEIKKIPTIINFLTGKKSDNQEQIRTIKKHTL
jgi:hypothetical protein